MLFPNDLSLHMVWAHLLNELPFQKKEQEDQKRWAATVHGLLKEAGLPISRENILAKYAELTEE